MRTRLLTLTAVAGILATAALAVRANPSATYLTWTAPLTSGTMIPTADLRADRGTIVSATLTLRNTANNQLRFRQFDAAELKASGRLPLTDGAWGTNVIVEGMTFTMAYPDGTFKSPVHSRATIDTWDALVWADGMLTPAMITGRGTAPDWRDNNAMIVIEAGSTPGNVLWHGICLRAGHSGDDGMHIPPA